MGNAKKEEGLTFLPCDEPKGIIIKREYLQTMGKSFKEIMVKALGPIATSIHLCKARRRLRKSVIRHIERDKFKVLFVVDRSECWNSFRSVFLECAALKDCEITLLAVPKYLAEKGKQRKDLFHLDKQEETYSLLKPYEKENVRVIRSHNPETGEEYSLEGRYNYIFLDSPFCYVYPDNISIEKLYERGRICFIPYYGFPASKDNYFAGFEADPAFLQYVDYWFAESKWMGNVTKRKLRLSSFAERKRIVYTYGPARIDLYPYEEFSGSIKTVLWNPRWTTPTNRENVQSFFLLYKDRILDFAEKHKDIEFIIRPHPLLLENFLKTGYITQKEVDDYLLRVKSLPNVTMDLLPSYEESLRKADVMLAEFSSLVAEYAVQGRPVIFLGERKDTNDVGPLPKSFYFLNGWDDVAKCLLSLKEEHDPLKNQRIEAVNQYRAYWGDNVGRKIVALLAKRNGKGI